MSDRISLNDDSKTAIKRAMKAKGFESLSEAADFLIKNGAGRLKALKAYAERVAAGEVGSGAKTKKDKKPKKAKKEKLEAASEKPKKKKKKIKAEAAASNGENKPKKKKKTKPEVEVAETADEELTLN